MAVGMSQTVADEILNAIGNNAALTVLTAIAADIWIQLHIAEPGAAGTTSVAGGGTPMVRKQVSMGTPATVTTTRVISNDVAVTWTSGEVDTAEDYTHFSLWDASTAGNFLWSGTVTANAVAVGDQFTITTGDLDLSLSLAT